MADPDRPRRRSASPLFLAGALARASARAVSDVVADTSNEVAAAAGRSLARQAERGLATVSAVSRRVLDGEIGLGPVRVRPDDVEWVRRQVAAGLRSLLAVPEETGEKLRTADPTTMARTVLALVGGEETLVPLPSPEDQIRDRFRSLLDPGADDAEGTLTPALLTITAQLSPDEARILRHLAATGRAPVVAVEGTTMLGRHPVVVADHLSVLVERSGGDHPARGAEYLDDLVRLGLVVVEDEALRDHPDGPLVETTTAYADAVERAQADGLRPRRRDGSVRLTSLGRQLTDIAIGGEQALPITPTDGPPPVPAAAGGVSRARIERPRR